MGMGRPKDQDRFPQAQDLRLPDGRVIPVRDLVKRVSERRSYDLLRGIEYSSTGRRRKITPPSQG